MGNYRSITLIAVAILAILMFCAQNIDPVHAQSDLADGILACWSLDEPNGPRADLVNFHHLSDINTVGYAGGVVDNAAYYVAGNVEALQRSTSGDPGLTPNTWTLAGWFYPQSTLAYMFSYAAGGSVVYAYWPAPSNKLRFYMNGTNVDSVEALSADTWYMVTFWHDDGGNQIGIQINNNTAATATYAGTMPANTMFNLGVSGLTTGRIDNVALWEEVLTGSERTEFYNGGAGISCADILTVPPDTGGGGPIGYVYDVNLPSGEVGAVEMYASAGDLINTAGIMGIGAVLLFYIIYRLAYYSSRR